MPNVWLQLYRSIAPRGNITIDRRTLWPGEAFTIAANTYCYIYYSMCAPHMSL